MMLQWLEWIHYNQVDIVATLLSCHYNGYTIAMLIQRLHYNHVATVATVDPL